MSIFPKRVTKSENVIIHLKTLNDKKVKYLNYETTIYDPEGNEADKFKNSLISSNNREVYYYHKVKENEIPGKYHLKTNMYINGRIINSFTSVADFYYVDEIKVSNVEKYDDIVSFRLENMSDELTPYMIIDSSGTPLVIDELKEYETKDLNVTTLDVFIKYGNNFIQKIMKDNGLVPIKRNGLRWRPNNGKVEIFDENLNETCLFGIIETKIWINIDGINSIGDIAEKTGIEIKEIVLKIKEMEKRRFVRIAL
jgi:hypothetical protein